MHAAFELSRIHKPRSGSHVCSRSVAVHRAHTSKVSFPVHNQQLGTLLSCSRVETLKKTLTKASLDSSSFPPFSAHVRSDFREGEAKIKEERWSACQLYSKKYLSVL